MWVHSFLAGQPMIARASETRQAQAEDLDNVKSLIRRVGVSSSAATTGYRGCARLGRGGGGGGPLNHQSCRVVEQEHTWAGGLGCAAASARLVVPSRRGRSGRVRIRVRTSAGRGSLMTAGTRPVSAIIIRPIGVGRLGLKTRLFFALFACCRLVIPIVKHLPDQLGGWMGRMYV